MSTVIVFDVNETLLDLRSLDPIFAAAFGDAAVRREWFGQVLQSAMTVTLTGSYVDFAEVGAAALAMVADRRQVELTDEMRRAVGAGMRQLPPHPDVPAALDRLREAGFRLATLTNNPGPVVEAQLTNAGLRDYFERVLTVDEVRRFKPAPEPYRMAADQLGVPIDGMRLVAAHAWDVAGAMAAGAAAAFVARPGMVLDPLAPRPDIVGADLSEVADRIVQTDTSET
ncbi:MAG: haloacid dehalogenase type II [Chloroflexia bacterium]|nr:haloacid dehalogenase type II [Chloroflexia bacterium]MDQ3412410.1 haloacid dehalogenase type II [Chloroflexota bacterium]